MYVISNLDVYHLMSPLSALYLICAISCDAEKDQIVEIKIILRYDVDYDKYAAGKESEVEK